MLNIYTHPWAESNVSLNTETLAAVGYVSSSTDVLGVLSLTYLFLQSYWNNRKHNLTGRLYYDGNSYGILLEGEKNKIVRVTRIIERDDRHKILQKCHIKDITQRHYDDWQMRFNGANDVAKLLPNYSHAIGEINGESADQVIQLMALYRV
jgi:hypothetical protein